MLFLWDLWINGKRKIEIIHQFGGYMGALFLPTTKNGSNAGGFQPKLRLVQVRMSKC